MTPVLYFGTDRRRTKPRCLPDCFEVADEFKPFVSDYKMNVFEIAYLPEETIRKFKSDFRIVADFFSQKQRYGQYNPEPIVMKHVQETLQLMRVLSGDHTYERCYREDVKGEIQTMCDILQKVREEASAEAEERGFLRGAAQGKEEGKIEGKIEGVSQLSALINLLLNKGDIDAIKRVSNDPVERENYYRMYGIA